MENTETHNMQGLNGESENFSTAVIQSIKDSVNYYAAYPGQIGLRLKELEQEWDLDKAFTANGAAFSLVGLIMTALFSKRWLLIPIIVSTLFVKKVLENSVPLAKLLRRQGVRSQAEIDCEYKALQNLQKSFTYAGQDSNTGATQEAAKALESVGIS